MNILPRKLTLQQERLAYRRAVRNILCAFFNKSPEEADALVGAWWERMGEGQAYKTGFFMHDEPVNTAADLLGVQAPSIGMLGEAYKTVLEEALPKRRVQQKKVTEQELRSHAA
jgi:hypothetical protein